MAFRKRIRHQAPLLPKFAGGLEGNENTYAGEVFFHDGNIRPPRSSRGNVKRLMPKFREEISRTFRSSRREFEHRRGMTSMVYVEGFLYARWPRDPQHDISLLALC